MGQIDDYLETVDGADRAVLEHVYAIARDVVPEAEEGTSYGMAALLYRDKGLVATVQARKFLSLYPFSGSVISALQESLSGFETTKGSIHFSAENPLSDDVVCHIVELRRDEIDARER